MQRILFESQPMKLKKAMYQFDNLPSTSSFVRKNLNLIRHRITIKLFILLIISLPCAAQKPAERQVFKVTTHEIAKTEFDLSDLHAPFVKATANRLQADSPVAMNTFSNPQAVSFPDSAAFSNPDLKYRAYAGLEFDLRTLDERAAINMIRHSKEKGYGGVFIVSTHGNAGDLDKDYIAQGKSHMKLGDEGIVYLGPEFFRIYKAAVEEAQKLGIQVIMYDDYEFPTGTVAGQFYQKYPELMASRLDKVEVNTKAGGTIDIKFPGGTILGAVLMNMEDRSLTDISDKIMERKVSVSVVKGDWKLMGFYLNHEAVLKIRNPGIINYIEKESVEKFLSVSYEKFYKAVGEYFGTVIPMSFYDEPSLHWLDGRMWSVDLNTKFMERYGESALKYYPSLWYDIGDKTASARNTLHGIRADMYSEAFIKQIHEWCKKHNLKLSGHVDQEEIPNPVMSNGDLMKIFECQDIPGADDIFFWGRSNTGYKIVTSASYNYDKPVTWAETYAAYGMINKDTAYRVAMDQYAMGINMQTPFPSGIEMKLSLNEIQEFNKYIGRLSYMLQGGRHVSDIAVLYPIASAMAYNVFDEGWEYAYLGGNMPKELDYMTVGEILFRSLRVDYTYIHPEVFDRKCKIESNEIYLKNEVNEERYKLFVLPGGSTIKASNAEKLLEFYNNGGKIIATSMLPFYSAEFGKDEVVRNAMMKIFNIKETSLLNNKYSVNGNYLFNSNQKGGNAYFLPRLAPELLNDIVNLCLPLRDVAFPYLDPGSPYERLRSIHNTSGEVDFIFFNNDSIKNYHGALTYTHKVKEGHDIYFLSNSAEDTVKTTVRIRGKKEIGIWDPHSGKYQMIDIKHLVQNGVDLTEFQLELEGPHSLFFVSN